MMAQQGASGASYTYNVGRERAGTAERATGRRQGPRRVPESGAEPDPSQEPGRIRVRSQVKG